MKGKWIERKLEKNCHFVSRTRTHSLNILVAANHCTPPSQSDLIISTQPKTLLVLFICSLMTFLTKKNSSCESLNQMIQLEQALHALYRAIALSNKCRPILVQGLRRDIEINFHINSLYGSVAQSEE